MHQKDLARQAWTRAGLYDSDDVKLRQFLTLIESPTDCWPEVVEQARTRYPEYKERVVKPLWDSGDKLVRLNLVRIADLEQADEVKLLMGAAAASDPAHDEPELRAMALRNHPPLLHELARNKALSPELRALVTRRIQVTEHQAAHAPEPPLAKDEKPEPRR